MNTTTNMNTKRASVEFNGMELVAAYLFLDKTIKNYTEFTHRISEDLTKNNDLLESIIKFNKLGDLIYYMVDISKKRLITDKFISNFREVVLPEEFHPDNIACIFISGKINTHPEITELNKDVNKLEAKGDIYIQLQNSQIIGVSIKQSIDATKSNYSVQKMLGQECNVQLTSIKKNYLLDNGFSHFDKLQRDAVNKLFYPQIKNNPYWLEMKKMILMQNADISKKLVESLYCSNLKYDMYEFDGLHFTKLNTVIDSVQITFEEHLPYYLDKKGKERETAKLFYRLTIHEKIFRVEVRWKGNVYSASPQFQMHEDVQDVQDVQEDEEEVVSVVEEDI